MGKDMLFYLDWSKKTSIVRWHLRRDFKEEERCVM